MDANEYIWTASRNSNFLDEFVAGGRLLLGIICKFIYGSLCTTIADLKWIRLISLVGCVLFSIQVFSFLLKLKMKTYESAIFSFLILTIPSFSVYYGWSATSEIPFLLNINFLAGLLLIKSFEKKKNRYLYYLASLLLVIISLCIYQAAVMVFLIPFIFSSVMTKNFPIKKVISLLIFISISFSIYFIIFKLSLYWYNVEPSKRTSLNLIELPLKVIIFYLREMRIPLSGSGFLIGPILFLIIGVFCFSGFIYSFFQNRNKIPQPFFFISCLILVLPLTYLPNLLSAQKFVCSRTIAPTAIATLFYQFFFLRQLSLKSKVLKKMSLGLVLTLIILSSINLNYYKAKIHNKEYKAIKTAFNKVPIGNTKKIILIKPKHLFLKENKFYKRESADEFAEISSTRDWVPIPLFNQISKERIDSLGLEKNDFPTNNNIEVYELGEEYNGDNSIIINLIDVLKNEFSK
ncbi:glucosyltransferase domain-containing protein [Flavivirga algicola]|uniref:Glycosyltransferase RgtA/B/C/D-like domain-containing protein n=1 Tax=Flavivirga algicola TaxID=2729136 RepID=A0ABX1RYC1_9FLAO|nr:glucosyltransferase domain-containing protein [Flavivirga algicola]NMH87340.1 hypothetical protein [Flavivirga algicola]